jgi:hypothetical protein
MDAVSKPFERTTRLTGIISARHAKGDHSGHLDADRMIVETEKKIRRLSRLRIWEVRPIGGAQERMKPFTLDELLTIH